MFAYYTPEPRAAPAPDVNFCSFSLSRRGFTLSLTPIQIADRTHVHPSHTHTHTDGAEVLICELYCEMDTEMVPSYDTLMPSQDGEIIKSNRSGKDEFVKGRFFVIRRPVPIDESANPALKQMIKDMTLAINKYYAFGSCFSEDDT